MIDWSFVMSEEAAVKEYDAATKEIGDKIADLTLKQAVDLKDYLKDTYGLEPAAGGAVVMAGGGGGGEEEEVQDAFDVVLTAAGGKKIQVIKLVREVTGLGLKEAKELVDGAPSKVKEGVSREEADVLAEKIKEQGGEVEVK
jgi:large subunit ribosomal protein L7/L12